jgi:hypothetical protein
VQSYKRQGYARYSNLLTMQITSTLTVILDRPVNGCQLFNFEIMEEIFPGPATKRNEYKFDSTGAILKFGIALTKIATSR